MARVLTEHSLQAIGAFTPLLLHLPDHDPIPGVERTLDAYAASSATVLVLSADSGLTGYDTRPELDDGVQAQRDGGAVEHALNLRSRLDHRADMGVRRPVRGARRTLTQCTSIRGSSRRPTNAVWSLTVYQWD
jgi:hypothetical protein